MSTRLSTSSTRDSADFIVRESRHGAHNYHPVEVVLTRAQGSRCWDVEGREYLDMMSAYSTASLGHGNKAVLKVLSSQARRLDVTSRAYYNDQLPDWLETLTRLTGFERALPMNTGAEAVDTALKIARKWGETVKGIAADHTEIIACRGNFHGRTLGAISLSTEPQYRAHFGPLLSGTLTVPFNDVAALEAAITPNTAAFLVEPIQGEAGIVVPAPDYLRRVREVCTRHNVLLICDEIQTGLARTGRFLCYEHAGIRPDMVTLGKALGGGVYPVSAVVGTEQALGVLRPGDHGSTFGGNAIAAAVSLKALELLSAPELSQRVARLGERAMRKLRIALRGNPVVREIRGQGLFIGIELHSGFSARAVVDRLKERGILTKDTHETVIRLAPALTIKARELDRALETVISVLREFAT